MGKQCVEFLSRLNPTMLKRWGIFMAAVFVFALLENVCVRAQDTADVTPPGQTVGSDADQAQAQREQFVKEIRRVENLNKKYTKEIEDIRALLADKDADYQKRMQDLEDKLAAQQDENSKKAVAQEASQQTTQELEAKTNEMLSKGGDMDPQDQQFRAELAKAHYNMGNIYFERG